VLFAFKEATDADNAKIFADPQMKGMMDKANPIFDCKRLVYDFFKQLVHA
jgi:uncharacterized protein YbaA (DUF1428 family)